MVTNVFGVIDVNMLQKDIKSHLLLDRCEVRVDANMNPNTERLRLPNELLVKYLLDSKEFDQGFDITGKCVHSSVHLTTSPRADNALALAALRSTSPP